MGKEKTFRQVERRRGFTLLELLVVMAIIAVLMAMMVPVVRHAWRQASDLSNRASERR